VSGHLSTRRFNLLGEPAALVLLELSFWDVASLVEASVVVSTLERRGVGVVITALLAVALCACAVVSAEQLIGQKDDRRDRGEEPERSAYKIASKTHVRERERVVQRGRHPQQEAEEKDDANGMRIELRP
jgi:hypothetical protein